LIYLANSAVLVQIRVGLEVSKQYFITSLNGNRAILIEDGGHFISLYVGSNKVFLYFRLHLLAWIFTFPFKLLCCSWLLQRVHCPIIPELGLLSSHLVEKPRDSLYSSSRCSLSCSRGYFAFPLSQPFCKPQNYGAIA